MTTGAANPRAALAADLRRYRTRLMLVRLVRDALAALVGVVVASAALAIVWTPRGTTMLVAVAAAMLAAILGTAIVAWRSAPTLAETAAAVDRELRSSNCVVTAVECLQDADPVADLVVREAARRLAATAPTHILPFQLPRRFGALASVAVVVAIVAALVQSRRPDETAMTAQTFRTTGAPPAGARGQRGASAATQNPPTDPPASARGEIARAGDAARIDRNANPRPPAAESGSAARGGSDASRAASAGQSGTPTTTTQPSIGHAASAAQSAGPEIGARGGRDLAGAPGRGAGRARGGANGSGGSGASGLASRTADGAGGVNGGAAPLTAPDATRASTVSPARAADVETAYRRAQAVIARERIPADLRQVVQDYFTAIRRARP